MFATFTDDILKRIFFNENIRISIKFSLKFVPKLSNSRYPSIGLDNGLAPNRRQSITWTNTDPVQRHIYASLGGNELVSP